MVPVSLNPAIKSRIETGIKVSVIIPEPRLARCGSDFGWKQSTELRATGLGQSDSQALPNLPIGWSVHVQVP